MDIPITFLDFKTEENYLALQNKYARFGEQNNVIEDDYQKVVKDGFMIIYKSINSVTYLEEYLQYSFIEDFLLLKIPNLAKSYADSFKRYIQNDLLIEKDKVKRASEIQLKKFFVLIEIIKNAEYLNKKIRIKLLTQIDITIEYLSNVHILPNYTVDDKFKFNLNKTDVLVLFTLMREKKIINCPYDNLLGFLLEKNCLYQDDDKYTPIKNAGKVVNDFKNNNRTIEKSVKRLKDIFNSDEFYEFEVH